MKKNIFLRGDKKETQTENNRWKNIKETQTENNRWKNKKETQRENRWKQRKEIQREERNDFQINKQIKNESIIVPEDFPTIEETKEKKTTNESNESSVWKKAILKTKLKEEEKIDVNNLKYWRGNIWIGPVCMKQEKYSEKWSNYIKEAQKGHASSIVFPYKKIQYSRDNVNWYNSLDETFTPEQLEKMNKQKLEEYEKKMNDDLERKLNNLYEIRKEESIRYYEETGNLDSFAIAEIERQEYEEYAKQFEMDEEEDVNLENNEYSEYSDEEYDEY